MNILFFSQGRGLFEEKKKWKKSLIVRVWTGCCLIISRNIYFCVQITVSWMLTYNITYVFIKELMDILKKN